MVVSGNKQKDGKGALEPCLQRIVEFLSTFLASLKMMKKCYEIALLKKKSICFLKI